MLYIKCYYCKKDLGEMSITNFVKQYIGELISGSKRPFCDEKCYQEYLKQFYVETYNDKNIYKINIDDQILYLPYIGCHYGFLTIEECKLRMDNPTVSFVDMNMWELLNI